MLDMQGLLQDYRLLKIVEIEEIYDTHEKYGEYTTYLNMQCFNWQAQKESGSSAQLFLGDQSINFSGEKTTPYKSDLEKKLNNQKMRLPKISKCWGMDQTIMIKDELIDSINFCPILGITKTPAVITDAVGDTHTGYTALSFHKALSYARAESRLEHVPVEQRPFISLAINTFEKLIVVHKSVLEKWKEGDVKEVMYEFKEKQLELKKIIKKKHSSLFGGDINYSSIENFQNNITV